VRRTTPIALLVFATRTLGAQVSAVTATVDLSASDIRYDLFEASTALAISPTIAFDRGWTSVAARATALRFESGHRDLHGSLVGTTFTPAFGPFRLEAGVDAGVSRYLSLPAFSHVFGAADLHYLTPRLGAWVGGTAGSTSFGTRGRGTGTVGGGVWASNSWATLTVTASHSTIGDTSYTDLEGTARMTQGRLALVGRLGARVGSTGGGHGVYGESVLTYALTDAFGMTLGAGRYPTDPARGTIAGRYMTIGVRIGTTSARPADPYRETLERYRPVPSADPPVTAGVEVVGRVLRIRADDAGKVEVMGDFTDWEPVPVTGAGIVLAPGPHLLAIRIDGGPWEVPEGATRVKDEFGTEVGLIVVQ